MFCPSNYKNRETSRQEIGSIRKTYGETGNGNDRLATTSNVNKRNLKCCDLNRVKQMNFFHGYERLLLTFVFEILLLATCVFGDKSLTFVASMKAKHSGQIWIRAAVDSATHGSIALLSWAVVEMTSLSNINVKTLTNCLDALSLSKRPPFHATTIIPVVFLTLLCTGYTLQSKQTKMFSFIYLTSWLSHHIRDATRRGLWLPPFGSTLPLHYWMYIFLILFLPLCIRTCMWYFVLYVDVHTGGHDPSHSVSATIDQI
ncbi:transmembrane protein 267-like isoform X2 [Gigantopelta aegis]|uniref:transmembrane protein 267-like isoform X2 n=1 Tax=Gigantopelta aegis TaxID=1735272 RepID=UPI001B88CC4C|nr:transmembrane protein 267-like isoform X2 [Gigantopelta aegis]